MSGIEKHEWVFRMGFIAMVLVIIKNLVITEDERKTNINGKLAKLNKIELMELTSQQWGIFFSVQ